MDPSGDLSIEGNLGTWDTGLKSYVYLPSHPEDHPVDLRGLYTIRLVVTRDDGATVEDRVTVEVGEAMPNAWGATVRSDDDQVTLTVREQSLTEAFRVMAIRKLDALPDAVTPPPGVVGHVYQAREPGEPFLSPATLAMPSGTPTPEAATIVAWDRTAARWTPLRSNQDPANGTTLADVTELSPFYAVVVGTPAVDRPSVGRVAGDSVRPFSPSHFVWNTFETGIEQWSGRDGEFGADVALDASATSDGTNALRVTRRSTRGTFGVSAASGPFDARDYPVVQFDYRIGRGVETDVLARVAGRWHLIRFTGQERDLRYKRVNISSIGAIEGVHADDRWHTAKFNLLDMLLTQTGQTIVDELVMANWEVGGFMRLQLSSAARGSTYYIDNFQIRRDTSSGLHLGGTRLVVDDFNQQKESNAVGGGWSVYQDALGRIICSTSWRFVAPAPSPIRSSRRIPAPWRWPKASSSISA
jgi:hypothetical protein